MRHCDDARALSERFELGEVDPQHGPVVPAEKVVDFAKALKDLGYHYFVTCTAVHFPAVAGEEEDPGTPEHFLVAYRFRRLPDGHFAFKVEVPEGGSCPSVTPIWAGADWHEREQFDLLGVTFDGHPDLRRIMMPEDWKGHPLRKDYAIETRHFPWR